MNDPRRVADAYLATWNETDARRRRALLDEAWAADATYVDPMAGASGAQRIDELIGAVQARFPDFRFMLLGTPDGHGEHVRFSWALGPEGIDAPIEGTDVLTVRDGRIRSVTGFLDKVPADA